MWKCRHQLSSLTPHPPSQSASIVLDLSLSLSITTRVESWEYNMLYTFIISTGIHILDTVPFTFPMVRTKVICFTVKSLFRLGSFPLFSLPNCLIQGWSTEEKVDIERTWPPTRNRGFNFAVCRLPFAVCSLPPLCIKNLLKLSMCFSSHCIGFHGCALVDVQSS